METVGRIKRSLVYLFLCFLSMVITAVVTVIALPGLVRFEFIAEHGIAAVLLLYVLVNIFVYGFYARMRKKENS